MADTTDVRTEINELIIHCKRHPDDAEAVEVLKQIVALHRRPLVQSVSALLKDAEVSAIKLAVAKGADEVFMASSVESLKEAFGYQNASPEIRLGIEMLSLSLINYHTNLQWYNTSFGTFYSAANERHRSAMLDRAHSRLVKSLDSLNRLRKLKVTVSRERVDADKSVVVESVSVE